jgi:hypothetical protein
LKKGRGSKRGDFEEGDKKKESPQKERRKAVCKVHVIP